jgi:hypothetical protein
MISEVCLNDPAVRLKVLEARAGTCLSIKSAPGQLKRVNITNRQTACLEIEEWNKESSIRVMNLTIGERDEAEIERMNPPAAERGEPLLLA